MKRWLDSIRKIGAGPADRLDDQICLTVIGITLAYLLYHLIKAGWLF